MAARVQVTLGKQTPAKCARPAFFPFKAAPQPWRRRACGPAGEVSAGRAEQRAEAAAAAAAGRSWRQLSDGTPCQTSGRTEFARMAVSSSLSELGSIPPPPHSTIAVFKRAVFKGPPLSLARSLPVPRRWFRRGMLLVGAASLLVTGVCLASQ